MKGWYPIFLNIAGETCLVVGGGEVAERKVAALLEHGARVKVVARRASPALRQLAAQGKIELKESAFNPSDLERLKPGRSLVFIATDDREVNREVFAEADALGLAANTADDPELCAFLVPAVVRRGSLHIAISTEGKSPLLARRIREKLEAEFGPEYAVLVELLGDFRSLVMRSGLDQSDRRKAFQELVDSDLLELIRQGKKELAKERVFQCLSSWLD